MKRILTKGLLGFFSLSLAACAIKDNSYPNTDQTNESWSGYVQTSPNTWVNGASRWFLTGDPNVTEEENMAAPVKDAISTMMVRVADFNKIKVDGAFQVQIFGTDEHNSVNVYGPNAAVRQVAVEVKGDTLCLRAAKDASNNKLKKVIIRVGVGELTKLTQLGCGRIEARQIRSTGLDVISHGSGRVYLAGNINLRHVKQQGDGAINVFGVTASSLEIATAKNGGVNISGYMALRAINHAGNNDINIIGATGGNLRIYSEGQGRITINGNVNVREIKSKDDAAVYAYCVKTDDLYVYASGHSTVGLSGRAKDLYIETTGQSTFFGRDLIAKSAYARAHDGSHINVMARSKIYASSTNYSSIYFFGTPNLLSQYLSDNGAILPIWFDRLNHPAICPAINNSVNQVYKDGQSASLHRVRSRHNK